MIPTTHNVEQMARGYLMYELAKRGYCVQITDSRFPAYDMLVVSPSGKHFGIEVKGQRTKNFWRFDERTPNPEMYYAFIYVPLDGSPKVFIMDSEITMKLHRQYKQRTIAKGPVRDNQWGINWKDPCQFEDRYDLLPA
jgi:hypothetical protein